LETTILRTPGLLYQHQENGTISNLYNIKIINKTVKPENVELRLTSVKGEIRMVKGPIHIKPSTIYEDVFFLDIDPASLPQKKNMIEVGVYMGDKLIEDLDLTFIGDK